MKKIIFVFLIFCFSLTVISCSDEKEEFTATPKASPTSWTKQLGSSSNDDAFGVATDSSGNVYVTGATTGGLDGNTSAYGNDLFVVKYNSSGTKQWTKQLGTSSNDYARGVATDSSGNVYVAGDTYGGLDGNNNAGNRDLFVVKYNSDGVKQ
ncbi:uncharacterized protein METZ01_LOCUS291846 [marine metagenome]|uniref:Bulb-type lectin domain-containing protein n=1 Tax=marine metagenome TaxID=408172 RepID=A0A382LVA8_9ZZZZ